MPEIVVEFYDEVINEVRGVPPGVRFQVREMQETESFDEEDIRTDPNGDIYVKLYDSLEPPMPDKLELLGIMQEVRKIFKKRGKFPRTPLGKLMSPEDFTNEFPKPLIMQMYMGLPYELENPIPGITVRVIETGDMSFFDDENVKTDEHGDRYVDYGTWGQ